MIHGDNYSWIHDHLFKQYLDHILKTCIGEDEIHDIFHAFHDAPPRGHCLEKKTTYKILQDSYYWTRLYKDA